MSEMIPCNDTMPTQARTHVRAREREREDSILLDNFVVGQVVTPLSDTPAAHYAPLEAKP